ncbi:MAG: phage tail tape measure protein [Acidovorax sp.]|jgi:TP901 family phage tail tape measure protein|nr:phage tail tape measure protein [Acidovorax sp.]
MADTRLQLILELKDKVMAPLRGIQASSQEASRALSETRAKLRQLEGQQEALQRFDKGAQSLSAAGNQLKVLRQNMQALQATGQGGGSQAAKLQREIEAQTVKYDKQKASVMQLRSSLTNMGITSVSAAQQRMGTDIAAATAKIDAQKAALRGLEDQRKRVAAVKNARQANVDSRAQARGALFDGVAMAATLGAPLKMAVDFESSMADVAKVMDFGDDKNGLEKMSKSALDLSKRLPMAAKDIAQIMALGGQSGLSLGEIVGNGKDVGFAEHAVKMGTAFGMSAEDAGNAMAKMKSAFGMSIADVATLTDKVNLLGNTGAASEKQILNILTRVGPLGAVAGVASGQIAAMGSTLAGMGVQEEVAATGIQNFMLALTRGASASKKQRAMLKSLGLDCTKVAKSMQTDATGTMMKVLQSVKMLPKYEQAAALEELFGRESIKAIAPLLTQLDSLKENFNKVGDASRYAGAVNDEYATRAATTANQLQLAKNQIATFSIHLGNIMLPALNDTLKALTPWMERITALAQAYPGITRAIVMGTAALVLFKIAAIAGTYAFTFLRGSLLTAQAAVMGMRTAMPALAAGLKGTQLAAVGIGKVIPGALARIGGMLKGLPGSMWALGKSAWGAFSVAGSSIKTATLRLWAYVGAQKAAALAGARRGAAGIGAYAAKRGPAGIAVDAAKGLKGMGLAAVQAGVGAVTGSFKGLLGIVKLVSRAMFMNPMGLVITVMAGAALLVIKYWQPISAFFAGFLQGLTQGLAPLGGMFSGAFGVLGSMLAPLRPLWDGLVATFSAVWGWISKLLGPFEATKQSLDSATQAGQGFGAWLASLVVLAAELVGKFFNLGRDIVSGLIGGITSMIGAVGETISNLAGSTIGWFKEKLGIHSPSRVFMAAGVNVGEGAAIGIDSTQAMVRKSAAGMVAAASMALPAMGMDAPGMPAAAAVAIDKRPPLSASAASRPAPIVQGDTITIQIHAAPGMDALAIGRAVEDVLRRREQEKAARMQSAFVDWS